MAVTIGSLLRGSLFGKLNMQSRGFDKLSHLRQAQPVVEFIETTVRRSDVYLCWVVSPQIPQIITDFDDMLLAFCIGIGWFLQWIKNQAFPLTSDFPPSVS